MIDGNGKRRRTIRAMHGTPRRISRFDPAMVGSTTSGVEEDEVGFFFTRRRRTALRYAKGADATIVHVELEPANPYVVTGIEWAEGAGLTPRQALEAGHDCYVVSPFFDGPMWIALDPDIVRVASIEAIDGR
jgi:hypothetical protein